MMSSWLKSSLAIAVLAMGIQGSLLAAVPTVDETRIIQRLDEIGAVPTDANRAPGVEYGLSLRPVEADIDLARGEISLVEDDIVCEGLIPWGHRRTYSNLRWYDLNNQGNRWAISQLPQLIQVASSSSWIVRTAAGVSIPFNSISGSLKPTFGNTETLGLDSNNNWVFNDSNGYRITFVPRAGAFVMDSYRSPSGAMVWATWVTGSTGQNQLNRVWQAVSGVKTDADWELNYEYTNSVSNTAFITAVQLRLNRAGMVPVRRVEYEYYTGPLANIGDVGYLGDLKRVTIRSGDFNGGIIGRSYYRYHSSAMTGGNVFGLMTHLIRPKTYARLEKTFGSDPDVWSTSTLDTQADRVWTYDWNALPKDFKRVWQQTARGEVGVDAVGIWKFTYFPKNSYINNFQYPNNRPDYPDIWKEKTMIERFDLANNPTQTRWVYVNASDAVLLDSTENPTDVTIPKKRWINFYAYDSYGRKILHAYPDAVTGWDDTIYLDLVGKRTTASPFVVGPNAQYLTDATGKFETMTYTPMTQTLNLATTTLAGDVPGLLSQTALRKGELGVINALQSATSYMLRTGFSGESIAVPVSETVFPTETATPIGGQTTTTTYTWLGTTLFANRKTTTMPLASTGLNGSGIASSNLQEYDAYGHPTWRQDPDGYLHYQMYDLLTGGRVRIIDDVATSRASDFSGLPSGWITTGGVHSIIYISVDNLGRPLSWTDPLGVVTYYTYDDVAKEYRMYPAWNAASVSAPLVKAGAVRPPFVVRRENWADNWREALSVQAPTSTGAPTGTEAIGIISAMTREQLDVHGHTISSRSYRSMTGVNYSATAFDLGTKNTNYEESVAVYDNRGRIASSVDAAGTWTWTDYDFLSRPIAAYSGIGPANKYQTKSMVYDGGVVGNGNLTQETVLDGTKSMVTTRLYDWRDRLTTTTGADFVRQVVTFDNRNRVVQRDAIRSNATDTVEATAVSGVLGKREFWRYDEAGRVYQAETQPADAAGTLQASTILRYWYDQRGNLLKLREPNGLLRKGVYDGLSRRIRSSLSVDGSEGNWAAAKDLTGDQVIEQSDVWFTAASDQVAQVEYKRFDSNAVTGPLTSLTAYATASVAWFDAAHRQVASANYGRDNDATTRYVLAASGAILLTNGMPTEATGAPRAPNGSTLWQATATAYDANGRHMQDTDNAGRISSTTYDLLGRKIRTVQGLVNGNP